MSGGNGWPGDEEIAEVDAELIEEAREILQNQDDDDGK